MIESLDAEPSEQCEQAWLDEAERRYTAYAKGEIKGRPTRACCRKSIWFFCRKTSHHMIVLYLVGKTATPYQQRRSYSINDKLVKNMMNAVEPEMEMYRQ